ncbi:SAF domain-containing protein, partial [Nonomuraea sp. NPDC055795]
LGSGDKRQLPAEAPALRKLGKKLVAARDLDTGHVLTEDDIAIKSPGGDGMRPYLLGQVVGRTLRAPLAFDADLSPDLLD